MLIWAGLAGPSILSPCSRLPQGTSGFSSHNLPPRGPCCSVAASTLCPPLPLTQCVRKHPTPRRGKSGSAEIHAAALWEAEAGRGRKSTFHFGPKTIVWLFEKSLVFFHSDFGSVGSHRLQVFTGFKYEGALWDGVLLKCVWVLDECGPVLSWKGLGPLEDRITVGEGALLFQGNLTG